MAKTLKLRKVASSTSLMYFWCVVCAKRTHASAIAAPLPIGDAVGFQIAKQLFFQVHGQGGDCGLRVARSLAAGRAVVLLQEALIGLLAGRRRQNGSVRLRLRWRRLPLSLEESGLDGAHGDFLLALEVHDAVLLLPGVLAGNFLRQDVAPLVEPRARLVLAGGGIPVEVADDLALLVALVQPALVLGRELAGVLDSTVSGQFFGRDLARFLAGDMAHGVFIRLDRVLLPAVDELVLVLGVGQVLRQDVGRGAGESDGVAGLVAAQQPTPGRVVFGRVPVLLAPVLLLLSRRRRGWLSLLMASTEPFAELRGVLLIALDVGSHLLVVLLELLVLSIHPSDVLQGGRFVRAEIEPVGALGVFEPCR